MNFKTVPTRFFVTLSVLATLPSLPAIPYTYDTDGVGAGVITEGSGTGWNLTDAFWNNADTLSVWSNLSTDTAIFGGGAAGTAGTVTVATGIITNGITFNTPNAGSYTLTGGTISLQGATPTITANATAVTNSSLLGSGGMTKSGAANLTLGGSAANTLTGTTFITAGTLTLAKNTSVTALNDDVNISTGGTLAWNTTNHQIVDSADITVSGGLINFNNRSETFASYTQTSGGLTGGNGGAVTVDGAFSISGGNQFVVNSAGQLTVNSMSLTGGNGLLVGGNNTSVVTTVNIGTGGLTLGGRIIQLNQGTAVNAKGALLNLNGTLTSTGSSFIQSDTPASPTFTPIVNLGADRTIDVTNVGDILTFDGRLDITGTGTTLKTGAGTLNLSVTPDTNSINFTTLQIAAGIVSLGDHGQLADTTAITNTGGQFTGNGRTETIASYTQSGATNGITSGLNGNLTITGTTALSGTGTGLVVSSGSTFTTNTLDTSGFSTSPAVLVGQNSTTAVTRLNIGSGGLIMNGQNITLNRATTAGTFGNEILLNGNVTTSGINSIAFNTDGTLVDNAIGQLNLGNATRTWNITGAVTDVTTLSLPVVGLGGLTKTGTGTLRLGGVNANTYSGDTNANEGKISLAKSNNVNAIAGDLFINNGGAVEWITNEQIDDQSDITLSTGGFMNLAGRNETFQNFTKTGGTIQSTGGFINITGLMAISGGGSNSSTVIETGFRYIINSSGVTTAHTSTFFGAGNDGLYLGGNSATRITRFIAGNGGITLEGKNVRLDRANAIANQGSEFVLQGTLTASGNTNFIIGSSLLGISNFNLNGAERTLNITSGTTTINLNIVSNNLEEKVADITATATPGGVQKTGTGTLALNNTNTYTGKTTVEQGTLRLGTASYGTAPDIVNTSGSIDDSIWLDVHTAATFHNNTGGTYLYDGTISGTGSFTGNFTLGDNVGSVQSTGILRAGGSSNSNILASAGDQIGTITFANNLELGAPTLPATSTLRAELQIISATGNASSSFTGNLTTWAAAIATNHITLVTGTPGNHDHLQVDGTLTLNAGGTIAVTDSLGTYVPQFGDVFNLLDFGGTLVNNGFNVGTNFRTGGDGGGDLILPDISAYAGLYWDVSEFTNTGIVVVSGTAVPEPTRALLLLFGFSLALNRQRRCRS
ncbi:PEP-CTERM sorting domain-containing protein [Phragmitibacter flavus]|uniref:PEP-CTERM sorting domain-containing protein n=1 Tax=Phragmitibacter flavus TaxID=2576071 RepID=A0A5R8KAL0_9BACT|nr:autotransporter-associated beta strand repeat-containing protein [Phragmitibacter flavus]TLD69343.1 PEP-CTERM sorting domain-containing protein [Phragmitibacter flavus]